MDLLQTYRTILDKDYLQYLDSIGVEETHTGYFSIDRKGKAIDSRIKRGQDSSDDISAYDLILKNKERLLSFKEPVRFIFSHSALREGWDNPNVFQICTLKHSDSQIAKRQEVGRGLRLCVNQNGDRMDKESLGKLVHDMNILTVIASDSYSQFVRDLQKDIKDNLYDRPTKATREYFFGKIVETEEGSREITDKEASDIVFYLIRSDYINNDFEVTDKYHKDLENDELLPVPEDLKEMEEGIHYLVQAIFDESVLDKMIKNDHETKLTDNELNNNFYKKEFQSLWNLINNKYSYKVKFDSEELVDKAIKYIDDNLKVSKLQYTISQGIQHEELDEHAFDRLDSFEVLETKTQVLDHASISQVEYDLVGKISEETVLTRGTIVKILKGIEERTFQMFKDNPEEFITKVTRLINSQKATMVVDHITYNRTENKYDSSIFTAGSKNKNIKNALKTNKHIQDYVFVDGISEDSVKSRFAKSIDRADEVVVYAKLPKGFAIPTPVGNYTPDWAIAFKEGAVKHVYFIAETKGSLDSMELRNIEKAKIDCAKSLFNNISTNNLRYNHVTDYQSLLNIVK